MRCPQCDEIIATGCLCDFEDTDCMFWGGDGSGGSPKTLYPIWDPSLDNLGSCGADGMQGLLPAVISNPPACQAYNSTNLSIPNNVATAVTMNSEAYDTDTMHSTSANTSRVTFTTAGIYTITFEFVWDKNAVGDRMAWIREGGSNLLAYDSKRHGGSDLYVGHSLEVIESFTAGQYVEGVVQQTSGGALLLVNEVLAPTLSASYR